MGGLFRIFYLFITRSTFFCDALFFISILSIISGHNPLLLLFLANFESFFEKKKILEFVDVKRKPFSSLQIVNPCYIF